MKKLLQRAMLYEVPIIGSIGRNQLDTAKFDPSAAALLEARQSESHQFISSLVKLQLLQ
jgi:hypothetical protein